MVNSKATLLFRCSVSVFCFGVLLLLVLLFSLICFIAIYPFSFKLHLMFTPLQTVIILCYQLDDGLIVVFLFKHIMYVHTICTRYIIPRFVHLKPKLEYQRSVLFTSLSYWGISISVLFTTSIGHIHITVLFSMIHTSHKT